MDILINELAYSAVWTKNNTVQKRTHMKPINILSTKTQTIILKPNQTQYSEEFQKICPIFDKKGRMHGFFVRTCLNKKNAHLDSLAD